jgi:hypothetical protein
MQSRNFHIKISPEFINGDKFFVKYNAGTSPTGVTIDPCCEITTPPTIENYIGYTIAYSAMSQVLSGGTKGTSLLTGLTVPIFLTQTAVDFGYYSVFDGFISQKDTMLNFLVSGSTNPPFYDCYFYNTSEVELKKYLSFTDYYLDWGDGSSVQIIGPNLPMPYQHTYQQPGEYTITFRGLSPWGNNLIKKKVYVPFTGVTIDNPNGTAYFTPQGGSWSGTALEYDFLYSGDTTCEIYQGGVNPYLSSPLVISGYTKSSIEDLSVYGPKNSLFGGKFKPDVQVTGTTGVVGTVFSGNPSLPYTAYTINGMDYYDYNDGTTLFIVSGVTPIDVICSAITKQEFLLNVVDEPEIQSDVYIERGKNSALERLVRLGEVDNVGDLTKYGYGFFNVIKT